MGTSASTTGPNNKSPLIPPWAEQGDPIEVSSSNVGEGEQGDGDAGENGNDSAQGDNAGKEGSKEIDNDKVQKQISGTSSGDPRPNRLAGARRTFGEYAKGSGSSLRSSLKKFSKGSGGGAGTSRRLASGITAGAGLLGMMQGDSVSTQKRTLSISELNGLSTDQAIDRITEHLTPENGDADAVRLALDFALAEVLPEDEVFDEKMFTDEVVEQAIAYYLTDLILQDVTEGMGKAWFNAEHPSKHNSMEEELRELIKVITFTKIESATHGRAGNITQDNIVQIQADVISQTVQEWESYDD